MPEEKIINIRSFNSNVNNNSILETITVENLPDVVKTFISEELAIYDNKNSKEGELIMAMKNSPMDVDYFTDKDGNLIVKGKDSNSYYLNNDGELIWS